MITDEQIKQLAVSCGFKLTNETGDDLKPYVYEFARELIALAQQVKPLDCDYPGTCKSDMVCKSMPQSTTRLSAWCWSKRNE